MRLLELVRLATPLWCISNALLALSLKLSDKELVVVLARFNRNLRSRKMSDILCGDLRVEAEATDEAVEAPEAVVLSLGLPTSRVPMKQCVSAMIFMGFRAHFFPWYVF